MCCGENRAPRRTGQAIGPEQGVEAERGSRWLSRVPECLEEARPPMGGGKDKGTGPWVGRALVCAFSALSRGAQGEDACGPRGSGGGLVLLRGWGAVARVRTHSLKSRRVMPLASFFFLRIALAHPGRGSLCYLYLSLLPFSLSLLFSGRQSALVLQEELLYGQV